MCNSPSVGIYWFFNDEVIFSDPIEVEKGQPYGDCVNGLTDHASFWDKLEETGELQKIPAARRSEYFYVPRGRVVFHKDTGRFTVLHGNLTKRQLEKVRKHFCLPKDKTDFDTDLHYQDYRG